jgi:hypothetical protein
MEQELKYIELISKKEEELYKINDAKIKAFNKLPWYKKIGKREQFRQEIINSWLYFSD